MKMKKHEVIAKVKEVNPLYFSKKTMKLFGQTLRDFMIMKISENLYVLYCQNYSKTLLMNVSAVCYNSENNTAKSIPISAGKWFSQESIKNIFLEEYKERTK